MFTIFDKGYISHVQFTYRKCNTLCKWMRKNFKKAIRKKLAKINKYFAKEDNQIDKNYTNSCSTWSDIINMQIKDTMRSLKNEK